MRLWQAGIALFLCLAAQAVDLANSDHHTNAALIIGGFSFDEVPVRRSSQIF